MEEERRLLAGLSLKAQVRLDDEAYARRPQPFRQRLPLAHLQHHAEVRHRHIVAVDGVAVRRCDRHARIQMGDDLMAVKIEVDPGFAAAALRATEQLAIEGAGGCQVMDGKGEMKGAHET